VNIGNPDEITIREFADEILKLTGADRKIIFQPLPENDPLQRKPDITKARELLGWEPKVHRARGLEITYEYFKSLPPEKLYKKEHKDFSSYNKD
jgi:dTDP-glucose 4,6-dehydratase